MAQPVADHCLEADSPSKRHTLAARMTSRSDLPWLILLLAGCSSDLGRVKITVVFENETRTQCIKIGRAHV